MPGKAKAKFIVPVTASIINPLVALKTPPGVPVMVGVGFGLFVQYDA